MKKIFFYTSILICIGLFQSCSKKSDEMLISPQISSTANIINATIKSTGIYQLSLSNVQNLTIAKQASHFQISEAGYDSKTGLMVYKYIPAQDYIGSDEVLLSTSKVVSSGIGGCHNDNSHASSTVTTSNISVKINVTN